MRASLLTKLIAAYLAPTAALLVFAPLVGYAVARRSLEEEVGKRLVSTASAAAASLRPDLLRTLQPGDEGTRTFRNTLTRLEALRAGAKAERLYVFDSQRHLLVGTGETLSIGSPLPSLERDRLEIERAFQGEGTPSSVTFKGLDGRTYKSGYAPLFDGDQVVAAVGVDASAEFFDVLRHFGASMVGLAAFFGAAGLALFFLVGSRWVVRPVRSLLGTVERIGRGDLASPVVSVGTAELALLAQGLERMRAQLFDRERETQMMLGGIAHEVRNPLGGIELFAGILAEDLAGDPEKLAHVQRVQKELSHLKRVVEDFVGYARELRPTLEPLALSPMLRDIAELVRPQAEAKAQSVAIDCEDGSLVLCAEASALRRALLNLARNAVEAAPRGGRVSLSARRRGDRVLIAIEDDGPGVPEAEREQLFTPFHTTKEKGLGLGLALTRRIAEAHHGSVRFEPGAVGARFVLDFPQGNGCGQPDQPRLGEEIAAGAP